MVGGIVGILIGLNALFPQVLNPPSPSPTSDMVTPIARPSAAASQATTPPVAGSPSTVTAQADPGWPPEPLAAGNDFASVTVRVQPDHFCSGNKGWVTPAWPTEHPYAPQFDTTTWALNNGAVLNSGNYIELTVQVQNNHRLTVNSIGAKAETTSPPLQGYFPNLSGGCGAEVPATFRVNLDTGLTTSIKGLDQAGREIEPLPLPHTLNEQDRESVWKIQIVTDNCDCQFIPYFSYTAEDGVPRIFEVRLSEDRPWRVTSPSNAKMVTRTGATGTWTLVP